ncbi:MAG TPA: Gfo/Idh/MocA family oxidoreductase [Tepidisphaeraceae bacterium]|nr:Gfo/Idh/MocA family oxidoreductase [Tepidisphaeraceae bacterium]
MADFKKIRIGVAGQGRSGYSIHVKTITGLPEMFELVAVADLLPERREDAVKLVPGCKTYEKAEEMLQDGNIELMVVSTPSYLHTAHTRAALAAGRGVLCEKPFALTLADFDETVSEAKKLGRFLAPFQQRRYEPSLAKIQEIIAAGTLGRIVHCRVAMHNFARRWDWQTLKQFGGGQLYNNCPHVIDLGLQLFGPEDPSEIFGDLQRTLASGDAEDHVKITLKRKGQPTVDIEWFATDAFGTDLWTIMGTSGTLRGSVNALEWKSVDWKDYPPRPVDPTPTKGRSYNSEKLHFKDDKWEMPKETTDNATLFYRDLYHSFREGKELHVTVESVRRQIVIIDHCRKTCPV